jgi:hypothetical protein
MAESRRRVVVARAGTLQSAERVLVLVLVLAILAATGPVRMMLAGLACSAGKGTGEACVLPNVLGNAVKVDERESE